MKKILIVLAALLLPAAANAAELIQNGSFEDGTYVIDPNIDCCNYIHVANGSNAIAGWSIFSSGDGVAWALNAGDAGGAPDGTHFVDLTGFGANSVDGTMSQTINTVAGQIYSVSFASYGVLPQVTIGSTVITLAPTGTTGQWNIMTGSYLAAGGAELFSIADLPLGPQQIVFIDQVSVTGALGGVPEPATWAMFLVGFGAVGFAMRRPLRNAVVPFA